MYKNSCDMVAWDIEGFKRLSMEITKIDNRALDILGLPGLIGAIKKGQCDGTEYLNDVEGTSVPGEWEEYGFGEVEESSFEVVQLV